LYVKYFKAAMALKDCDSWLVAIEEEHKQMKKHNVWTPVEKSAIHSDDRVLTNTWDMKKDQWKISRTVNCQRFQSIRRHTLQLDSTPSPITNDTIIQIMFVLTILADWKSYVVDVQGAFLNGRFESGDQDTGWFHDKIGK
jgi:hypothetical protein